MNNRNSLLLARIAELEAENTELRKDKARLDRIIEFSNQGEDLWFEEEFWEEVVDAVAADESERDPDDIKHFGRVALDRRLAAIYAAMERE